MYSTVTVSTVSGNVFKKSLKKKKNQVMSVSQKLGLQTLGSV